MKRRNFLKALAASVALPSAATAAFRGPDISPQIEFADPTEWKWDPASWQFSNGSERHSLEEIIDGCTKDTVKRIGLKVTRRYDDEVRVAGFGTLDTKAEGTPIPWLFDDPSCKERG